MRTLAPIETKKLETLKNTTMGYRLRWLRAWYNLTQAESADLIGVHQSTISQWERDMRFPYLEYVHRITTVYQLPEDFFQDIKMSQVKKSRKILTERKDEI